VRTWLERTGFEKRHLRLLVGLLVSAVALVFAFRGVNLRQAARSLAQARYVYLIPAGGALLAYLLARSLRWRILLGPQVDLAQAFAVTNIGYLVSNVLPFRLGDPARAVAVGLRGRVKVSAALSTVVVERVLDMLLVVLLLAATLPFVERVGKLRVVGPWAGGVAALALAIAILLAQRPEWARAVARRALGWAPSVDRRRWLDMLDGLLDGLAALRSPRRVVAVLAWSAVAWACVVAHYYCMLRAFLDRVTLVDSGFLSCAIGFGMAVPSAPGAVGAFHYVAEYALVLLGVERELALVAGSAAHAFQYILMCLLGLVGLFQQNLSLGRLRTGIASTLREEQDG